MRPGLTPGARAELRFTVTEAELVPALFGGTAFPTMPAVLATGQMVALFEWACVRQMVPFYEDGEDSLGVHVDFDHAAPTLPGQVVTVETEVTAVEGRFVDFRVEAADEVGRIGGGRHRRAVIETAKFAGRLAARRAAAGLEG